MATTATTHELRYKIIVDETNGTVQVRKFRQEMELVAKSTERTTSRMNKAWNGVSRVLGGIKNTLFNLKTLLLGIFAGAVVKSIIRTGDVVEKTRLRLVALKGGVDGAAKAFARFQEVARAVPFTLEDVSEAGVKLEAFGVESEKLLPSLADLATLMNTDMVNASNALGRAWAAGRSGARMLRNRGILALVDSFAKLKGISTNTLPGFRKALWGALTDPSGKIAGSAQKLAKTWTGQVSMMQDAIFRLQNAIAKAGLLGYAKNIVRETTVLLKAFEKAFNPKLVEALTTTMGEFTPSANGAASSILYLAKAWTYVKIAVHETRLVFISFVKWVETSTMDLEKAVMSFGKVVVSFIGKSFAALANIVGKSIGTVIFEVKEKIRGIAETVKGLLGETAASPLFAMVDGLQEVENRSDALGASVLDSANKIASGFKLSQLRLDGFKAAMKDIAAAEALSKEELVKLNNALKVFDKTFKTTQQAIDQIRSQGTPGITNLGDPNFGQNQPGGLGDGGNDRDKEKARAERLLESLRTYGMSKLEVLMGQYETEKALLEKYELDTTNLTRKYEDERLKIKQNRFKAEMKLTASGFNALGSLSEAFLGENHKVTKSFAIAEALVNTYAGVTNALRFLKPPESFIVAAKTLAMGMKQVKAIKSTKPGGGASAGSIGGGASGSSTPETATSGGLIAGQRDANEEVQRISPISVTAIVNGDALDADQMGEKIGTVIADAVGDRRVSFTNREAA